MASRHFRDAVGIDPDRIVSAAVDAALGKTQSRQKKHHPGRAVVAGAALATAAAVGQKRMPRLVKMPLRMGLRKLGDMTHADELADALRDRLVGHEDEPDDDDYYEDEENLEDADFDDEDEFDDEPRGEAEDEPDDEDGEEGFDDEDDEDDEDFDYEPEDGDGPRGEGDEVDDEEFDGDELEDAVEGESDEEEPEEAGPEEAEPDEDDEQIAARSLDLGIPPEANGRRARNRVPDLFEALRTPHRRAPVMRRGSLRVDPATRPPEPDESRPRDEHRGRSNNPKSTAARA